MDMSRITSPRNSITWPTPPLTPMRLMMVRMTSLGVPHAGSEPVTSTDICLRGCWDSVCVAKTCSTSEVPMPKARAPKAPWVEVWESPQTMVMPGWVRPCSGPTMCTMPWRRSSTSKRGMPNSSQLRRKASTCRRERGSGKGLSRSTVGTL